MTLRTLLPAIALITTSLPAASPDASTAAPAPTATPPTSLKKAALSAPVKDSKLPEDALGEPASQWRFSASAQWRQVGRLNFHGDAKAPGFGLPPPSIKANPPQVGDPGTIGDRTYSDGFVKTDNSGSSSTWNWGYNNGGQVSGTTLSLHASGTMLSEQTSARSFNSDWRDEPSGGGGFVKFESPELYRLNNFSFSTEAGLSLTRSESIHTGNAFQASQQSDLRTVSVTDRYDTTGVVVPGAPYAGSFSIPGPIISNLPSSRSVATTAHSLSETDLTSTLRNRLTTELHTLSFGPDAHFDSDRLRIGLGTGLAVNVTRWEAATHEDLRSSTGGTLQQWNATHNGTDLHAGLYVEVAATYQLNERLSLFTSGRYDWSDTLHGHVGGSSFELGLGGWTVAAGVTLKF